MVDPSDDDEQRLLDLFRVLRTHVVQVSAEFGARLGVRLRAISASLDSPDPGVLDVFGRTVAETTELMLAPLSRPSEPAGGDSPASTPSDPAPAGSKENNDG